MGTTTYGLPYPEGSDLVADGDNAIKALATAIDPKLTAGAILGTVSLATENNVTVSGDSNTCKSSFTLLSTRRVLFLASGLVKAVTADAGTLAIYIYVAGAPRMRLFSSGTLSANAVVALSGSVVLSLSGAQTASMMTTWTGGAAIRYQPQFHLTCIDAGP